MGTSANLWITNSEGNIVKGDSQIWGRDNSINLMTIDHGIHSPYDKHTGKNTSPRVHSPFSIIKEIDSSTPFFNKACCNGEKIQEVIIKLFRINQNGHEVEYFKYQLEDVKVVSVIPCITCSIGAPDSEKIQLIYGKITWSFLEGNFSHSDSWNDR